MTRVARLDDMPEGPVEVVLPGITGRAEPDSFRARTSGREVVSVRARVVLPGARPPRSDLDQRLLGARHAVAWLEAELAQLTAWRDALAASEPRVDLTNRRGLPDPLARTKDLLAARGMLSRRNADLQARIDALHEALAAARSQLDAAQLDAPQAQSAGHAGEPPTRIGPACGCRCSRATSSATPGSRGSRRCGAAAPSGLRPAPTVPSPRASTHSSRPTPPPSPPSVHPCPKRRHRRR